MGKRQRPRLQEEDFYQRSEEFRVWLYREQEGKILNDLSKEKCAKYFKKFIKRWNHHELPAMYYEGIPLHILEGLQLTKHRWSFVSKLTPEEKFQMASTVDSIKLKSSQDLGQTKISYSTPAVPKTLPREIKAAGQLDREDQYKQEKAERRAHFQHQKMVQEELVPVATGRDALLEKKRMVGQKISAAHRQQEEDRDGLNLSESVTMGGGDDFEARVRSRQMARDRKSMQQTERMQEIQQNEKDRMQKFLQDMGLQAGQRIQIPKRE